MIDERCYKSRGVRNSGVGKLLQNLMSVRALKRWVTMQTNKVNNKSNKIIIKVKDSKIN